MIIRVKSRHKSLYLTLLSLGVASFLLLSSGFGVTGIAIVLGLLVVLLKYATGPLSVLIARSRYGIRFKFELAIAFMGAMFLFVSLFSFAARDYMHVRLHSILDLSTANPDVIIGAVDRLEDTQHSLLFSLTPALSILDVILAVVLSSSMALSVINPVGRMSKAMRKIATGDFSEKLTVDNRDELGELAMGINEAADDLARLQKTRLADERASALKEQIARVTLAQEEERKRISRELHDELGPSLAALGNRLMSSRSLTKADPSALDKELEEVAGELRKHVGEIRALIYELRPMGLDQIGLIGALKQHIDRFGRDSRIKATLLADNEISLDPLEEVTVFRIVQESMNNVEKHSEATLVEVTITNDNQWLHVSIVDNGRGFGDEHQPTNGSKGVGLLSMQERAELVGGSLEVVSTPGEGCRVTLRLPRKKVKVGSDTSPAGG